MKKAFIAIVLVAIIAITGCGIKTGIVERLAITVIAQEMGVEFARLNPGLVKEAIVYLNAIEEFKTDQIKYVSMIQIGINYAFKQLDSERAA